MTVKGSLTDITLIVFYLNCVEIGLFECDLDFFRTDFFCNFRMGNSRSLCGEGRARPFCEQKSTIVRARPNILFILADDVGWNDISLHAGSSWPTPNIDSIAYGGLELMQYYVQPVCSPSRASLLTGRHVIHTGVYQAFISDKAPFQFLNTSFTLLPSLLKQAGNYSTALIGKWHLGYGSEMSVPLSRGFDLFTGFYSATEGKSKHQIKPVFDGPNPRTVYDFATGFTGTGARQAFEYNGTNSQKIFKEETIQLLQRHRQGIDQPFFTLLSMQAVHSPYIMSDNLTDWALCSTLTSEYNRKCVCAEMLEMDRTVGELMETMRVGGMLDNTIVIFSSDNGGPNSGWENGSNNAPLRGGKSSLWQGGVKSIGLIQGPAHLIDAIGHQHQYNGKFHVTDWLPTILGFVAASSETPLNLDLNLNPADGLSQSAAISDSALPYPRNWVLLETRPAAADACIGGIASPSSCTGWPYPFYHGHGIIVDDLKLVQLTDTLPYGVYLADGSIRFFDKGKRSLEQVLCDINGWTPPPDINPNGRPYSVSCPATDPIEFNTSFIAHQCHDSFCLFNLTADPCEKKDLAAEFPDKVVALKKVLENFRKTAVLGPSRGTCEPIEQVIHSTGAVINVLGPCEP